MPSHTNGTHLEIGRDDVRDDIHAVALRTLAPTHHFRNKPGPEQETVLDRVIQKAEGSFLWTILAYELLVLQRSGDNFTKVLGSLISSRPSVQDLCLKLLTTLDPSGDAKLAASWIPAAERPLTMEEMQCLFMVDVQRRTLNDQRVDTFATISSLRPLMSIHDSIVRFRHVSIKAALRTLARQDKILIHDKETQMELLLKLLTYAKCCIQEKGEPVIEPSNLTLTTRLFRQHPFLEYVTRYWPKHLRQSSLAPTLSSDSKLPIELHKAFPDNTILPILEQMCWDSQLPISEAADCHVLVGNLRRRILGQKHPAVLQSFLACAGCYILISEPSLAQDYYYFCVNISRAILSDVHPLTLDCAHRFLQITEDTTSSTRTEIKNREKKSFSCWLRPTSDNMAVLQSW